ncbi:hypothetical protein Fot_52284 [Forsythia ovata]|uniref:Uncharacterized protein n=1 Tax=Forsythia ovata TaxID=205694 RepID=A0ABD1PK92_9LAMI
MEEAPLERTVAKSKSETHGMGLPPPTYVTVDQFETLQTQMTVMMTLLQNQINASADHVTLPPVDPVEHTHVQSSQGDPAAPVVDRRAPHPPVQDLSINIHPTTSYSFRLGTKTGRNVDPENRKCPDKEEG